MKKLILIIIVVFVVGYATCFGCERWYDLNDWSENYIITYENVKTVQWEQETGRIIILKDNGNEVIINE